MKIATFEKEKAYGDAGYEMIVGVDEVGRGPLAGPVVTAACVIKDVAHIACDTDRDKRWDLIRDSKLLSEKQRKEVYAFIEEFFYIGIGLSTPDTIDRINILQATFLAMKKAVVDLERVIDKACAYADAQRMIVLIDGNQLIPNFTREQACVSKGDQIVKSIAAASIIAKVTRDTMMEKYDAQYPQYGFAAHKGYGTKVHMDALTQYGATPIHRKSFAPVRNVL
ncbi:MAG: ribonuclease HII [Parcubacteria group bacterium]|jgi:ribonuclease HII